MVKKFSNFEKLMSKKSWGEISNDHFILWFSLIIKYGLNTFYQLNLFFYYFNFHAIKDSGSVKIHNLKSDIYISYDFSQLINELVCTKI